MKKITLPIFLLLAFICSWQANAQFTEGFDTEIPASWTVLNEDGGTYGWDFQTQYPKSGAGHARIHWEGAAHNDFLITPQITVTDGVSDRISFFAGISGTFWTETFDVRVSTSGTAAADFTDIIASETASTDVIVGNYTKYEYDLSSYNGQQIYVAIVATDTDRFYLYVDEFVNDAVPACPVPDNAIVMQTQTTADVSWDAIAEATSGYEWVIMTSGDAPDAGTAVASGSTLGGVLTDSASGLTETTNYDFYVRANCDTNGFSNWSDVLSFTTLSPAPNCAINPTPTDGATDVVTGNVTFSWEAPTTGPAPTSYNLYAGETPTGDDYGLIGNYTDLTAAITLTGYDTLLYWIIKPVNGTTEATGCPVWSFTTQSPPLGAVCENPIEITSIPYNTTDDTAGYGDDYENGDSSCNAFYMSGDDVVYAFTPAANGTFNVALTNIGATYSGIHVLDGCPGTTPNCMGFAGSSDATDRVFDVTLIGGTTYYIVISTFAAPQSVSYTLDITELNCTAAAVTSTSISVDCNIDSYYVDVDISDVADATEISDGTNTYAVTGTGVTQAGPYAFGTAVDLTLVHSDTACNIDLGNFNVGGCPPVNDACSGALALTPGVLFTDNPTVGTNEFATTSTGSPAPGCASYNGGDLWYSVVVPADGNIILEMNSNPTGGGGDAGAAAYSGTCGSLVLISCDDDGSDDGLYPLVSISDPALAGQTIYFRVWEYGNNATINFQVSAYSATLSVEDFQQQELFTYYPNPVSNALTLKAQQNIQDVAVYNMLGQEVLSVTPNSVTSEVNMTSLQAGAYFVKVMVANTTETIRIIKN